jgi:hypothetical protein
MVRRGVNIGAAACAIAAVGITAGCGGTDHAGRSKRTAGKPSYAELVAKNYKVLTRKQTRRLLRYAEDMHSCLAKQIRLGDPRPQRTKIVMALPAGASLRAVAQAGIACGTKVGGPPPGASLQTRKHAVLVYLPKYCILDRKVTRQLRAGKSH